MKRIPGSEQLEIFRECKELLDCWQDLPATGQVHNFMCASIEQANAKASCTFSDCNFGPASPSYISILSCACVRLQGAQLQGSHSLP